MLTIFAAKCSFELWGSELGDDSFQASINMAGQNNVTYQVESFWNGIGSSSGISSARISGCTAKLMDTNGQKKCILSPGNYNKSKFIPLCGNDVVTQYTILPGEI